jgi:hypothetical protein
MTGLLAAIAVTAVALAPPGGPSQPPDGRSDPPVRVVADAAASAEEGHEHALHGYVAAAASITHGGLRMPMPGGFTSYIRTATTVPAGDIPTVGQGSVRVTSYQLLHRTGALTVSFVVGYAKSDAEHMQEGLRAAAGVTEVNVGGHGAILQSTLAGGLAVQWAEPDGTIVTVAARDLDRKLVLDVAGSVRGRQP